MTGALVLAAAAACLPAPDGWPESFRPEACPQVYRIHGNAPSERALNIVVMPAGFTAEELPTFRCAARLMVDKLMTFAPFDRYACSINVYRIDLASPPMTVPAKCSGRDCEHAKVAWDGKAEECRQLESSPGCPERPLDAAPCLELDLDVDACPLSAPVCRVIWPSGKGMLRIWPVAACAPEANVVLVLVNSEEWAGGGIEDDHSRLVVTTMCGIDAAGTRSLLLAHELGHALGLFDEYFDGSAFVDGGQEPSFHAGRNIVKAGPDGKVATNPWAALCLNEQGGSEPCRVRCRQNDGCTPCEEAYGAAAGAPPLVGLFEGGFYAACGYYAATTYCRMLNPNDTTYCPACNLYLTELFGGQDLRMQRCPEGQTGPVPAGCAE